MLVPTGVTSAQYWNAIKAGNPTHVRFTFLGQNIVLEDQDVYLHDGVTVTDIFNGDTDVVFGKAISKQITVTFLNSSRLTGLKWTGEFTLEFGVEIGNPAVTNWVSIGIFSGEKPNNVTSSKIIKFTAYDRMKSFDILADDYIKNIEYPKTIQEIYDGLCAFVGVQNVSGDELPTIMSRSFASAPAEMIGYTCRNILAWIAESCGCYAKITATGNVKMVWFTDNTSHAVTGTEEFSIESGDVNTGLIWDEADTYIWDDFDLLTWNDVCGYQETYKIDQICIRQLNNSFEVNYPYNYGGNIYTIVENPFLSISSYDDVTNYVAPLFDRMDNFGGYIPVYLDCVGNWCVEAGDIITIDIEEETVAYPIFIKEFRWNGAVNDSYETTGNMNRAIYTNDFSRQQVLSSNKIEMYVSESETEMKDYADGKVDEVLDNVDQNYYKIRSGIVIDQDGVTVSGSKYVKIESGGAFNLNSENFVIDSENKIVNISTGTFNVTSGNFSVDSVNQKFKAGNWALQNSGLYSDFIGSGNRPRTFIITPGNTNNGNRGGINFQLTESTIGETGIFNISADVDNAMYIVPYNDGKGAIGYAGNKWGNVYAVNVRYENLIQLSSREVKHNIAPLGDMGDKIDGLQSVTYVYDDDANEKTRFGLIYEDAINIMPEICTGDESDKAIDYMQLVPVLLKEIQELRLRVKTLEEREVN